MRSLGARAFVGAFLKAFLKALDRAFEGASGPQRTFACTLGRCTLRGEGTLGSASR
jgi:hypothetical protein